MPPASRPRPGHDLVLTADALVAGVHFLRRSAGFHRAQGARRERLGSRRQGRGSDGFLPDPGPAARIGPRPGSPSSPRAWAGRRALGVSAAGRRHRRRAGRLTLSVTALGEVPAGRMVRRTAARAGDRVCVTGTIGDAALGLALRTPKAAVGRALARAPRPSGGPLSPSAAADRPGSRCSRARHRRYGRVRRPGRRPCQDDARQRRYAGDRSPSTCRSRRLPAPPSPPSRPSSTGS